jgi:hypothetical protein
LDRPIDADHAADLAADAADLAADADSAADSAADHAADHADHAAAADLTADHAADLAADAADHAADLAADLAADHADPSQRPHLIADSCNARTPRTADTTCSLRFSSSVSASTRSMFSRSRNAQNRHFTGSRLTPTGIAWRNSSGNVFASPLGNCSNSVSSRSASHSGIPSSVS